MKKIKKYIYYPIVRRIYRDLRKDANWVVVQSFNSEHTQQNEWVFDCLKTGFNKDKFEFYKKHMEFVAEHEDLFIKISNIVFNNEKERKSFLIVFDDDIQETLKQNNDVIIFNFVDVSDDIKKNFLSIEDICNINEKRNNILRSIERILITRKDYFYKYHADKDYLRKISNFIIWLCLHDIDAKGIIYIPFSNLQFSGGMTISLNAILPTQMFESLRAHLNFSLKVDYISAELKLKNMSEDFDISGLNFLHEVSLIIKNVVSDKFDQINEHHRNFLIPWHRTELIELEKQLVFHPLISETMMMGNVSWFSAFGWHNVNKELYRIEYDVIDDITGRCINWDTLERKFNQFHYFARKFDPLIQENELISLGKILFTQALNKKPIIISFLESDDRLNQNVITKGQNFIYLSFSKYYADISSTIKTYLDELDFNNNTQGVDIDNLTEAIEKIKHSHIVQEDIKKEFVQIFKALDIEITDEDSFAKKFYVYLCWLIAHDLNAKIIGYFPSSVIPNLPSGGFMIGFSSNPSILQLLCIQEFVNNFFTMKSYFLAELVPEFPNVLNQESFRRQMKRLMSKNVDKLYSYAFIDMDRLRDFNDSIQLPNGKNLALNHPGGTLALKMLISAIIKSCGKYYKNNYVLGKWGGDEFTLFVESSSIELKNILIDANKEIKNGEIFENEIADLQNANIINQEIVESLMANRDNFLSKLSFSAGVVSTEEVIDNELERTADTILHYFKSKNIRGYVANQNDYNNETLFISEHIDWVKRHGSDYLKKINNC